MSFRARLCRVEESTQFRYCLADIRCEDPSARLCLGRDDRTGGASQRSDKLEFDHRSIESGEAKGGGQQPAFQARGVCGHWPPGHPGKLKIEQSNTPGPVFCPGVDYFRRAAVPSRRGWAGAADTRSDCGGRSSSAPVHFPGQRVFRSVSGPPEPDGGNSRK